MTKILLKIHCYLSHKILSYI